MNNNSNEKGIGLLILVLLVGVFIFSIPDFFKDVGRERLDTPEKVEKYLIDFEVGIKTNCDLASLEQIEKNWKFLTPQNNMFSIIFPYRTSRIFFDGGYFFGNNIYIVEDKDKLKFLNLQKNSFFKLCVKKIDFNDNSKDNQYRIKELKRNWNATAKYEKNILTENEVNQLLEKNK
ncbi:hypothetical protein NG783_10545 [Aliarcobacter cryaerophilus]|uniref:hypothetical protein n=1 Tax=Aliarcobacter cryaerophilus TaxID=28198 RepID=UPI003DA2A336